MSPARTCPSTIVPEAHRDKVGFRATVTRSVAPWHPPRYRIGRDIYPKMTYREVMVRWKESAYLLLTALAEGENHGYALARRVVELSDGQIKVGAGTLYGTLERLQGAGLIELVREEVVDGRNRRIYAITGGGRQVLRDRAAQLTKQAGVMRQALGPA